MTTEREAVLALAGAGVEPDVNSRGVPKCIDECPSFEGGTWCKKDGGWGVNLGNICNPMVGRMALVLPNADPPGAVPVTLKPCPFCGGRASFARAEGRSLGHIVQCRGACGARQSSCETLDAAAATWNQRADD